MENWQIWLIAGIVLFIIEIFTPGFVLACFGLACLVACLVALSGFGIKLQLLFFSISSLFIFWQVRPFFVKYLDTSKDKIKTNVDALVGKKGIVSERIDPNTNRGRVIVNGEDWRGVSTDESVIEAGAKITVVKVEGTKLFVRPTFD